MTVAAMRPGTPTRYCLACHAMRHHSHVHTDALAARVLALTAATGGATVGLDLSSPATGYAVAIPGHEDIGTADAARVSAYVDAHLALLSDPGTYLGAWSHDGALYLDLSRVVPTLTEALAMGQDAGELAVFDLSTGHEIPCEVAS